MALPEHMAARSRPRLVGSDQRTGARRRVLLAGRLVYGEDDLVVDCAIRDLSETGAKVRVSGPVVLPAKVHLIELRTGQAFACEVIWRRMPELGLHFVETFDLANGDDRALFMLRRIWREGVNRYSAPA
jgi:hypothetical protein